MSRTRLFATASLTGALVLCPSLSGSARADSAGAEEIFAANCQSCHGKSGKGDTPLGKQLGVGDWTKQGSKLEGMSDAEIAKVIRSGVTEEGKVKMPAFEDLTEAETDGLVEYVRSLRPH